MDFTQNPNINQPAHHNAGVSPVGEHMKVANHKGKRSGIAWLRLGGVVLLFSITVIILALLTSIVLSQPKDEYKYVDSSKYQSVFLNGDQVYFGHITTLNNKFLRLQDIYYLRVNQEIQPNGKQQASAPLLVPLGCELHRPQNEMIINRDQVIFWENLKDESTENTVPGAIKKYVAENPNGKPCQTATPTTNKP